MTGSVAPAETPTAPTAKPDAVKGSRGRRWAIGLSLFTLLTLAGLTATGYWPVSYTHLTLPTKA